jgi:two-component system sensor histidine kinase AgrC
LEEEKLYNKTLTILYDNIRGFKHDFNNIVQAIGGYISTKNMKGLEEYYSQLLDDCQKVNNLTILSPEIINNPAIYSLLTSKYHRADEIGVHISLEVFLDLNTINMKIYELTRILGILIDNSIEAASNCEEKTVNIVIRKDSKSNRQLFVIENTYLSKDINIDKIFEKGYTSKESETKGHGLGLWEVRKVLKKNNNLNLHTTKDDKYFKQQLEIYY